MIKIRKISKIEHIKEEIKNFKKTIKNLTELSYYINGTIIKCELYDEDDELRYFEIDIKELKEAYYEYQKENNNKMTEIEQLLRIAEELNDDWLIVDCN